MIILLYQPQIPQNAGNIVRTAACSGCSIVMVRPLGFQTTDRWLKRAGLDYWEGVDVTFIDDLDGWLEETANPFTLFTSRASRRYTDVAYAENHTLVFGSETDGLPQNILDKWTDQTARIPMVEGRRCLNLATSVGIAVYEGIRQLPM
jgi:tRNA (cytidine/uridine-2'-O-)-methyltransferase